MRRLTLSMRRAGAWQRYIFVPVILLVAACDRDDPTAPGATVTVAGIVRTSAGAPIAGAAVSIGSAATTTGPDGRFELTNLIPGPATLRCIAAGFFDYDAGIMVPRGSMMRNISLNLAAQLEGGSYDLTLLGEPGWSELDGSLTAIASLSQVSPSRPQIVGTIMDWRHNGGPWLTGAAGSVTGSIDHDREIVLSGPVGPEGRMLRLTGSVLASGDIAGWWCLESAHPWTDECGRFTAKRRQPQ